MCKIDNDKKWKGFDECMKIVDNYFKTDDWMKYDWTKPFEFDNVPYSIPALSISKLGSISTSIYSIKETDDGVEVEFIIPGVEKESIKVSKVNEYIRVSYIPRNTDKESTYDVKITKNANFKKVQPVYKNGILTIYIANADEDKTEYVVV